MRRAGKVSTLTLSLCLTACATGAGTPVPSPSPTSPPATAGAGPTPTPAPTDSGRCDPAELLPPPTDARPIEPGTYCKQPEGTDIRARYTIAAEGWLNWPYKFEIGSDGIFRQVGVFVTTFSNVAVDACANQARREPPVGPTVDDLATALAGMPPFEVVSGPTAVTKYGFEGVHLELAIPPDVAFTHGPSGFTVRACGGGLLRTWSSPELPYVFWGYPNAQVREAFWILDVRGTRLVIETTWSLDSPLDHLEEREALLESIQID